MSTTYYNEETAAVMDDLDVLDTLFNDHSSIDGEDDEFEFDLEIDEVDIS